MDLPEVILAILAVATSAAGTAAWYKSSQGKDALELGQRVNDLQKDENLLLIKKNNYLQGQIDMKDEIIERLTKKNG